MQGLPICISLESLLNNFWNTFFSVEIITLRIFEILQFEGGSVLESTEQVSGRDRVKPSVKT